MYFPKNKIKTNLFAGSGDFITFDGSSYEGFYYELPNGRKFSGKVPGETISVEIFEGTEFSNPEQETPNVYEGFPNENNMGTLALFMDDPEPFQYIRGEKERERWNGERITKYFLLKGGNLSDIPSFKNPSSFIPQPTQKDYNFGTFKRYFVVKANEDIYIEVNKDTFNKINQKDPQWNFSPYLTFFLIWTLTGDESSVKNTNENIVKLTEKRLNRNGLSSFFSGRYLDFYSLNPGVILQSTSPYTRYYPDNGLIPEKLPPAYQLGNKFNETPNRNVPEKQNCSNCAFNLNGNCSKWKASIRSTYWCKAYKGTYGVGKLLNMTSQPMDSTESQPTPPSTYTPQTTTTPTPTPSPSTGGGSIGGGGYSGGGGGGY
jgi:hypothetical protein